MYNRGVIQAKSGRIEDAVKIFKEVIAKSPYYCLGHYGLGKSYLYIKGRTKDAIHHLRVSIFLDKSFSKGYFYLGLAYLFSRKYEYSIKKFYEAYRRDNNLVEALYNIAVVYDLMSNRVKSKLYFVKYTEEVKRKEAGDIF